MRSTMQYRYGRLDLQRTLLMMDKSFTMDVLEKVKVLRSSENRISFKPAFAGVEVVLHLV